MPQKKTITLDMLRAASSREVAVNPLTLPAFRLAALLNTFTFERLARLLDTVGLGALEAVTRDQLRQHTSALGPEGVLTLTDQTRSEVWVHAIQTDWLPQWLGRHELPDADVTEDLLWTYLDARRPRPAPLYEQDMTQLIATHRVVGWLSALPTAIQERLETDWPPSEEVYAYIKREELLIPFRRMTTRFQGRKAELAQLRDYVGWLDGRPTRELHERRPPLLISGIGGVGKSTLIARFILDHTHFDRERRIPFVYLDFDKSGFSISEPLTLASEALRQLALQFPTRTVGAGERTVRVAELMQDVRADIRTTLDKSGTKSGRGKFRAAEPAYEQQQSTISIRGNLYESISRQYLQRFEKELQGFATPLLVVLDSFEEAQYRASSSEIFNLFRFIDEIVGGFFPQLRLVIVGRNDLDYFGQSLTQLNLGPFDEPAALAYLQAAGITDRAFAQNLYREIGGNPLTLKLAAIFVRKEKERHPERPLSVQQLLSDIDAHRIQEHLVRRNLKHIKDRQVRQLAFPGMLVRRISPEVIRNVLAEPCGLGELTAETADYIYRKLQREQFLLETVGGALVFRRDLRVALGDLVVKEYGETAAQIHRNALAFYRNRKDPAGRAEYLYHWLMTGGAPGIIDKVNLPELRPFIEQYLPELPLNAYIYLAAQLGIRVRPDLISAARQPEWEDYLVRETEGAFFQGEESDLDLLVERWSERSERTGRPEVRYVEAKLAFRRTREDADPEALLRFQGADRHLGVHNLYCRQLELQRDFTRCFAELEKIDPVTFGKASGRDQLHFLLQYYRVGGRLGQQGRAFEQFFAYYQQKHFDTATVVDHLPLYYSALSYLLGEEARNLLEPYALFAEMRQFLDQNIRPALLSAADYTQLYEEIADLPDPLATLDQQLKSRLRQTVFTLTETGTRLVDISEVIYYLELRYGGDLERIREEILGLRRTEKIEEARSEIPALVEEAKQMISQARTEQAIVLLRNNLHLLGDYEKELYLVNSRFERMQREERMGTVSREESSREFNRINFTLLELLDQIAKR